MDEGLEAMTFFGYPVEWPFALLAYYGVAQFVVIAAWLLLPDGFAHAQERWTGRRVGQARTEAGHHRVQEVPDER